MVAGRLSFTSMFICLISGIAAAAAQDGVPNDLAAFVERTAADIGASPLNIPQFKSAKVDTIEDLGKANGTDRYLCWLRNDQGRVGYLAVAGDGKSFQVLAFSATALSSGYFGYDKAAQAIASSPVIEPFPALAASPVVSSPGYFLKHLETGRLSPKPLDFSRMGRLSFVENVPLVPAARTFWGTQPFEMSEMAASLSSIFNYVQNEKEILFFGRVDSQSNPEYRQLSFKASTAGQSHQDPNRKSFRDELHEAMRREPIPQGQTIEVRAAYRLRARDEIKPIIRRTLLDPLDAYERLAALQAEQDVSVIPIDISRGMRDAVILEMDYLEDGPANIKRNLDLFLKTRGRTANISIVPFAKMPADSLPAIVIGPDNTAALVLGNVDVDGEQFSLVFFPKTGKPSRMSLADKVRAQGLANRLVDPNRARDAKERERMVRSREMDETFILVEDPRSQLPDSLSVGIHVCRTSSLAQWQAVHVGKIDLADNWGFSER